jgi:hypothetical protein
VDTSTRSSQSTKENGTQMERIGYYYQPTKDKVLTPRPYFTSEENHELRTKKAIQIQTFIRGYLARKKANKLREELNAKREFLRMRVCIWTVYNIFIFDRKKYKEKRMRKKEETNWRGGRIPEPRGILSFCMPNWKVICLKDRCIFDSGIHNLLAWVKSEKEKIESAGHSKEERQELLKQLLLKQTELLQTIDRLKIKAAKENKKIEIYKNLKEVHIILSIFVSLKDRFK